MIAQGLPVPKSLQSSAFRLSTWVVTKKDRCLPQRPRRRARHRRRSAGFPGL